MNKLQDLLNEHETQERRIKDNENYSERGKLSALKKLNQEKNEAIRAMVPDLRRQAVSTALSLKVTQGVKGLLAGQRNDSLDYARLAYEAIAVRSAIVRAGRYEPQTVAKAWEQAKQSGDKHIIRAWLDTAPAEMPTDDNGAVLNDFQKIVDDMNTGNWLDTEEMQKYTKEQKDHIEELSEIRKTAAAINDALGAERGAVSKRVFEGVRIEDNNKIELDFYRQRENEEDEEVYQRLEAERTEKLKPYQEQAEKLGTELDPLLVAV